MTGDLTTPIGADEKRHCLLNIDRSKRTPADGPPPLVTNLVFLNVDGQPEDAALRAGIR